MLYIHLVSSYEPSHVRQAVILAGGQATRLRPYTDDRPKILVPIGHKTILEHQADWLAAEGIEHVVISCGYLAKVLTSFVEAHALPLAVTVVPEREPLGRGGGFKFAAARLPHAGARWLGLNGDILTNLSVADLFRSHVSRASVATVAIAPLRSPYGIVEVDDDMSISSFVESPILPHWINAGIYLFEPEVTDLLPSKGDHESLTFPTLATQRRLGAFRHTGYWRGIDTAKDIKDAERDAANRGGPVSVSSDSSGDIASR